MNLYHKVITIFINKFLIFLIISTSVLSADVLSYVNPKDSLENKDYFFSISSSASIDPISIKAFLNNWKGTFHPHTKNNIAIESTRLDLGLFLENNYYFGYTYRHDVFIEASNNLTKLLYLTKNKLDLPTNKTFNLYLKIKGLEAQGILIGKKFLFNLANNSKLSIFLSGSILYANNMQQGLLKGQAQIISNHDYNFKANTNYFYTHNYLYNHDVPKTSGFGFSTHLKINYNYKKISFSFIFNDIIGKVYWNSLPYSYVVMNSKNKHYDKNGYAQYSPTIHGIENRRNYIQKIPLKFYLEEEYKINNKYKLSMGFEYTNGYYFPFSKIKYERGKEDIVYFLSHEYRFNSTTVGIRYKKIFLSVSTDSFVKPSKLGILLSASLKF